MCGSGGKEVDSAKMGKRLWLDCFIYLGQRFTTVR